jgi:hypothetical protein
MKAKTREQRLLERIRVLEQELEAFPIALRAIPPEYVLELSTLAAIALYGVKRPEDRGYTKAAHAESRPPGYNSDAHKALSREAAELLKRSRDLAAVVRGFDPGVESGVESSMPGTESYQTLRVTR